MKTEKPITVIDDLRDVIDGVLIEDVIDMLKVVEEQHGGGLRLSLKLVKNRTVTRNRKDTYRVGVEVFKWE